MSNGATIKELQKHYIYAYDIYMYVLNLPCGLPYSILCFFMYKSIGFSFLVFHVGYSPPVNGIEAEIGIGDNAKAPSGPYFLGLPLFFFPSVLTGVSPATATPSGATTGAATGGDSAPKWIIFSVLEAICESSFPSISPKTKHNPQNIYLQFIISAPKNHKDQIFQSPFPRNTIKIQSLQERSQYIIKFKSFNHHFQRNTKKIQSLQRTESTNHKDSIFTENRVKKS